jgi:hypothetical protein
MDAEILSGWDAILPAPSMTLAADPYGPKSLVRTRKSTRSSLDNDNHILRDRSLNCAAARPSSARWPQEMKKVLLQIMN